MINFDDKLAELGDSEAKAEQQPEQQPAAQPAQEPQAEVKQEAPQASPAEEPPKELNKEQSNEEVKTEAGDKTAEVDKKEDDKEFKTPELVGKVPVGSRKNSTSVGAAVADLSGKTAKDSTQEVVEGAAEPPKKLPENLEKHNVDRVKKEEPKGISGIPVINQDPGLKQYEGDIKSRIDLYHNWIKRFDDAEGGILKIAESYKKFGLNRVEGGIQYREWAPCARRVCLCGDFNGWNRDSHECKRNEYGVWELFIPNLPDGSSPIKHGSKVKAALVLADGSHVSLYIINRQIEILLG